MMSNIAFKQDKFNPRPVKFVMWLFVLSSIMMFAGLTSAYIVRQAEGNWKIFDLPSTTHIYNLKNLTSQNRN